jgi:hypothetical protein
MLTHQAAAATSAAVIASQVTTSFLSLLVGTAAICQLDAGQQLCFTTAMGTVSGSVNRGAVCVQAGRARCSTTVTYWIWLK